MQSLLRTKLHLRVRKCTENRIVYDLPKNKMSHAFDNQQIENSSVTPPTAVILTLACKTEATTSCLK